MMTMLLASILVVRFFQGFRARAAVESGLLDWRADTAIQIEPVQPEKKKERKQSGTRPSGVNKAIRRWKNCGGKLSVCPRVRRLEIIQVMETLRRRAIYNCYIRALARAQEDFLVTNKGALVM